MRPEKKSIVEQIRNEVKGSLFVILTDYRGLTVSQTEDLRNRLHGVQAHVRVVKNRMFRHVAREMNYDMEETLKGPSAMIVGDGDVVATAKVLKDFIRENKLPVLKVGALEGVILSADDVKKLADLPPKPVMQAQLLGTLAAPMTQLMGVMQQKMASIVYVLKAIQEKNEKQLK
ncbi:MAG: 50S ribosomal protein L10 [Spartobacteria bacterium]|nr:50S ribosomal protein L10 [Spartobacteria bacterium]